MKKNLTSEHLILIIIVFIVVLFGIFLTIYFIGQRYKNNISSHDAPDIKTNVNLENALDVSGITLRKKGQKGCINITSDGQVRIYKTCDEQIDTVYRTFNNKSVNRLMDLVKSGKLSKTKKDGAYELIVHTDQGDIVYYIDESDAGNNGGGSGGEDVVDEIIDIIEDIENDQPQDSPTPTETNYLPNITSTITPTLNPTIIYWGTPTPTPIVEAENIDQSFTCDYIDDSGGPKPYRVSNVVCSTEPADPK